MKMTWKALSTVVALSLLAASARADDAKNPADFAKAMEEAAKPGPEHAKLQPLVGSWTYTCKIWMEPGKPPLECHGTIDRKWVLGGRFLEERVNGTGFDGKTPFEGFGLVGYDKGRKQYTSTWACTLCTGASTGVGSSDTSGTRFTFQTEGFCPLQNKVVKGREELRIQPDGKTVAESFQMIDGKEIKMMEITAVRKK